MERKNRSRKKVIFEFKQLPEYNSVHRFRRHDYTIRCFEPYRCKDGRDSFIITWESRCQECGRNFYLTTGLKAYYLTKHCILHQKGSKTMREKRLARWAISILNMHHERLLKRTSD